MIDELQDFARLTSKSKNLKSEIRRGKFDMNSGLKQNECDSRDSHDSFDSLVGHYYLL